MRDGAAKRRCNALCGARVMRASAMMRETARYARCALCARVRDAQRRGKPGSARKSA